MQNFAKFCENLRKFAKFCKIIILHHFAKFCNFFENSVRNFVDHFEKMLKNAYLDAKFRFDTDENEPKKE